MAKKKKTLLEQWHEEEQARQNAVRRAYEEKQQLEKELAEAKSKYQQLVHEQYVDGKNHEQEIYALDDKIVKLEKQLRKANAGYHAVNHGVFPKKIKKEQVIAEWNNEILPKFMEEKMNPVLERLEELKFQYCQAAVDAINTENELKRLREEYFAVFEYDPKIGKHLGTYQLKDFTFDTKRYLVTESDFKEVYHQINPKIPSSLKPYLDKKSQGEGEGK